MSFCSVHASFELKQEPVQFIASDLAIAQDGWRSHTKPEQQQQPAIQTNKHLGVSYHFIRNVFYYCGKCGDRRCSNWPTRKQIKNKTLRK